MSAPDFRQAAAGEWMAFAPGKSRRILLHTAELMQVEARIAAGLSTPEHSHPHAQVSYVLSGRIRVTIGGQTAELTAGGSFIVPPHVTHGAVALTDLLLLDTFAPARLDFL